MSGVKRLSKVAREFNLGIHTIVEFLESKGKSIESSPNAKIEEDAYDLLVLEFQSEKQTKEKAEEISLQFKTERKTLTLKDVEQKSEPIEDEGEDIDLLKLKRDATKQPELKKATLSDENKLKGPAVVGKVDLDAMNTKTRPDKKSKKEKEEETKKTKKLEAKPIVKESPKVEEPIKEERPEIETIKTQFQKLSGPSVVGKIDLPVEKAPTPFKKPETNDDRKKKRKRIKKVNIEKTGEKVYKEHRKAKQAEAVKKEVSEVEIQKEIKETLAKLSGQGAKSKSSKFRREKRQNVQEKRQEELAQQEIDKSTLKVTEFVTVSELGNMMGKTPTEIISTLMTIGIFASINQRLDAETLVMVAEEFGYKVEFVDAEVSQAIEVDEEVDDEESLIPRPPIVTVMGHVDHGKTSLLDNIRKTNVIEGEAGGITQHIGAYSVTGESGKKITFLDTPGHEAFTAMRARGAQVTDIAIIIIAADDQIMPQTEEAINHAQAAGVPMVFAINKIDKAGANSDKIREQLAAMNILVEEWGGKFQCQEISAKKGIGVEELLEKVLLEAELLELKANPNKRAVGVVIESSLDKGRGYVTTLLVEAGTLRVGDVIVAGTQAGRIRAMHNERGEALKEAAPSTPVSVLGFNGPTNAGDKFTIMADEREARQIATKREQLLREQGIRTKKVLTLDEIGRRLALGSFKELNIIVKGDVDGSVEALSDSLLKLSTNEVQVNIIHKGVGQISESDVLLATASDAIIIGFQVRPSSSARKLAEVENVDIRLYSIIYKAIEEIKDAMEGMLSPDIKEEIVGTAEIREVFKISKVGTIAGCYVTEGKIVRNYKVRIIRDGIVIYTGNLGSLKRFKDDAKEVTHGYECGLNIDKFNDIKVGDLVESFHEVQVAKKL
ncbi:MAG: translation initiation factor IF-2 [Bacteroidia bacterium]